MPRRAAHGSNADRIAQLRDDIRALRSMIDSALDNGANPHALRAMADVLRERREQLEALEQEAALGTPRRSQQ